MKTKIRKKKCSICGEKFTPYKSTQRVCSPKCAIEHTNLKKAENTAGLNRMRNEKESEESLAQLTKQTQILVNKYIRARDKGKPCISCDVKWNNRFQACHRFDVKQHNGLRFDFFNIFGGCPKCNIWENGNYQQYDLRLPNRIGEEEYQKLHKRAKIALRIPYSWTKRELRQVQKQVKELIKSLT